MTPTHRGKYVEHGLDYIIVICDVVEDVGLVVQVLCGLLTLKSIYETLLLLVGLFNTHDIVEISHCVKIINLTQE